MSAEELSRDAATVVPLRGEASGAPPTSPKGGKGAGVGGRKRDKKPPAGFFDNLQMLTRKCALIHGTGTAWDGQYRCIVKVSDMRLTYGNEAVKAWLNSPDRRLVLPEQVVFDPTETADPRTHVNLFHGFERKPKAGACERIVELLRFLCQRDEAVVQWILRWCALPLQRPGTKLATAVIMHGAEGTGKNMFWSVVQAIYGRYGTIIGQSQIESDFNSWLSAKLFVVGNEVLGRKEKWELRGALKHLVTEDTIHINEKNMRERAERNHANLVFLSNELQPLAISGGDRRYLVVDCWNEHPDGKGYYDRVRAEIDAGGIEAFYDYLLKLPLGDFTAHTKPIVTTAKRELIELGRDDSERFLEHWKQGLLSVPYGAAPFDELYVQLRRWCQSEGERHVPTKTRFGRMARTRLRSKVTRAHGAGGFATRQRTVYWDEEAIPESCEDVDAWLRARCTAFLEALGPADGEGESKW